MFVNKRIQTNINISLWYDRIPLWIFYRIPIMLETIPFSRLSIRRRQWKDTKPFPFLGEHKKKSSRPPINTICVYPLLYCNSLDSVQNKTTIKFASLRFKNEKQINDHQHNSKKKIGKEKRNSIHVHLL